MSVFSEIRDVFRPVGREFLESPPLQRIFRREITSQHYKSYLRQVFHHARENPQLQALATVHFRGPQRNLVKAFLKHATSEIGHDQLALNDIEALGGNTDDVHKENPLPETSALLAFGFYQIYNLNPVGYLGYLFFLEFLPTTHGAEVLAALAACDIPERAMSFLIDHSRIDVGHNRLMERYIDGLVRDDRDIDSINYAIKATGRLYSGMLAASFDEADRPKFWGASSEERMRSAVKSERQAEAEYT